MGTFGGYTGQMRIKEEQKELFAKQIMKILNYGGMMSFEAVNMYGSELGLLIPAKIFPGGECRFWYNYFEDTSWETAGFNASDCDFWSNKIGSQEFDDVVTAANFLYEVYDGNPGFVENPNLKFALFADGDKCMAYSASFGVSNIKKNKVEVFKKGLNHTKYISVREFRGKDLVKELVDKDAQVVLDPTLLLKKYEWQEYAKHVENLPEKYLLTYGFNLPKAFREYVDNVAKKYGLEVVNINKFSNKFTTSTAQEFIDILLNASLICTNSFHGHDLSIALEKPFVSFPPKKSYDSRVSSILKIAGLEGRNYQQLKDEDLFRLDYEPVNKRLDAEREKSFNFLKNSLDSIIGNKQK